MPGPDLPHCHATQHLGRPYCRPVNIGPTRMDALKAEYGRRYDLGEEDGWYWAVPTKHPGGALSAVTPRLLAERIAADLAAAR